MTHRAKIVIIGAGIGGLTAAAALQQKGFDVSVYERATSLGEVGAGLQVGPNAVKVLLALGLGERLRQVTSEPPNFVSLDWKTAELRYREPLSPRSADAYGAPYLMAHRADLHALLTGLVPSSSIELGMQCIDVVTIDGRAVATFSDGQKIEADAIIGADGIHSVVRDKLFGSQPASFQNQICWRAMVPMSIVPTRVGPNRSVTLEHGEYSGWIGPAGHVICYPIRSGDILNIFAGKVSEDWIDDSWSIPSSKTELLDSYRGWNEDLLGIFEHVGECYKWGIHDRDPLERWVSGRIALIGDAAHPMMPTLAQGAAITMEDGYALARHLVLYSNIDDGLASFERERRPRASAVQTQARNQFQNNRRSPAPPPINRDWIFGYDATVHNAA